ncbi:phage tail assembly protein [Paraburkholderia sp. BR10879]|uniref:phage tail assembly protein n=1 Tax=Paraburkholderia sp. BR10879 TaxID=3236990 RepID=UPI003979FDC9
MHSHHITDAGHSHGITNPGHSHSHGITDPGHSHSVAPAVQPKANTVTLDYPIERNGGQSIGEITLRKPAAGELRGTSLNALVNLDVDALGKVLPRISSPTLTEFDVQQLDPADLVQLGVVFAGFLLPKRAQ